MEEGVDEEEVDVYKWRHVATLKSQIFPREVWLFPFHPAPTRPDLEDVSRPQIPRPILRDLRLAGITRPM